MQKLFSFGKKKKSGASGMPPRTPTQQRSSMASMPPPTPPTHEKVPLSKVSGDEMDLILSIFWFFVE